MHLLIAGYGQLGKELLAQSPHPVTAINRSAEGPAIECDITSQSALAQLTCSPTHVIHCAASGRGAGPDGYRQVYLTGMRNLVDRFPDAQFIFVSSTSVYGQTDGSVVDETSETDPSKETSRVLLETERVCLDQDGLVTRLAGLYGPGPSHLEKTYLEGNAQIEEDGQRHINKVSRKAAAAAILHLINQDQSGVFNVCEEPSLTQLETYKQLSEKYNKPLPPTGPRKQRTKRGWSDKQVSAEKLKATGFSLIKA